MGSKKKVAKAKVIKKSALVLVPIKIHPKEIRAIKAQAKKYAQGNFSAWLRHAGLRYRPKRGEHVETVTMPSAKSRSKKKR